jgi:glycosyltransferase involved in cell wall biosynthesis
MPRVSVIIPTYNRADLIGETIESVLNQTFGDFEIIIVDDGSTDSTKEVVRRFDGPIKYIYQENRGRSCARNQGFEASSGNYVCFLDSDDVLNPRMFERQVSLLESNSELGFVFSDYQFVNRAGEILPKPEVFCAHPLRRGRIFRFLIYFDFIFPSSVLARRDCVNKAGLFDPSLDAAEDLDWLLRMTRLYETDYIPEQLCLVRKHDGNTPSAAIEDGTARVITMHLSDDRTKRSLGDDWREIYFDLSLMVANYHYNRRSMAPARKYYFDALGFCSSMARGLGIFNLILKSYLGKGARNLVKRARAALIVVSATQSREAEKWETEK